MKGCSLAQPCPLIFRITGGLAMHRIAIPQYAIDRALARRGRLHPFEDLDPVGTATNVCCESTARDAMMLNYKVFFVSDANACRTDEEHNATLAILMIMFADVRSTDEMANLLQRHAAPVAGAAE